MSLNSRRGVLSVTFTLEANSGNRLEKKPRRMLVSITFSEVDLERTSQPHANALVITCMISGFLVKRVMVDQGSRAEIMYPDLYKGLGLKLKDLSKYDTFLLGFDGKVVTPEGQIKLLVVTEGKEVEVYFTVVNTYSPYTAILGHP